MCMMVYVASDCPLPTLAWDEGRPGFYVEALTARHDSVRRQFKKSYVFYVGSHQGCGCGFDWEGFEGVAEDEAEFIAARDSRRHLSEFLAMGLQSQQEIELFACWDGNQAADPEFCEKIHPAALLLDRTSFRENELLIVW